jgi:COP9 signalosome complex subunit 3
LLYYYYGSIVYIGNKRYDRALDFLSIVISAPTQKAISAIQIAAYKKFVLVSLISQGQLRSLPKYTAQGVEKLCRTQATSYINLVKAFDETDIQMFQDVVNKSSGLFESVIYITRHWISMFTRFLIGQTYGFD